MSTNKKRNSGRTKPVNSGMVCCGEKTSYDIINPLYGLIPVKG